MLERGKLDRGVVELVDTESLVPTEHLLRKIDASVDFNRIYEVVEPLYSEDNGRPSVDKAVFIDGTHIKANANTKKKMKAAIPAASKHYAQELMKEVNADREARGKKPFLKWKALLQILLTKRLTSARRYSMTAECSLPLMSAHRR